MASKLIKLINAQPLVTASFLNVLISFVVFRKELLNLNICITLKNDRVMAS